MFCYQYFLIGYRYSIKEIQRFGGQKFGGNLQLYKWQLAQVELRITGLIPCSFLRSLHIG